ncbi:MAG: hypothetical protein IJ480_09945 [Clostridia bacterium]|nr:hypothetical protein [Clostridia bacterium]
MNKLLQKINDTAPSYGSIPFWSWNDRLEEGELRRQIRRMKELGMNGFFMHARGGLETEYLSDDWFNCVNVCVDEAKKLGMEAWSYDENGWPSGFAGGKLLDDKKNFALGLLTETVSVFPDDEDTVAAYTKNEDGSYSWVTEPVENCGEYLRIYRQYDNSYVDVLDGSITKEFLRLTHAEYKKACGADFGGAMPGFFTDEPQYFRWGHTYSNTLPKVFRETYGYEIFPGLPAIFEKNVPGGDKFRYDYYKLIHELFINNWVKLVHEWCQENGVKLTGHAVEESSLSGQMMCIGGVMPFYEYEDIPGIDYLGRGIADDIAPKQLGSVCAQLGKKKALSEMFACCGWDVSPTELKRIADMQYAGGVNLMCQHLYPYSERGQRKRDYPLHYSEHNPWQDAMIPFDWHYNRLGAALAEGEEYAPILVIHPIHGAYMRYKKGADWHSEIEGHFFGLSRLLGHNQVPYHYGDENLMKKYAKVNGGKITVGQCTYDAVIVPFTYTLDHETADMLKEYMAGGGKVWLYKDAPACIDGEAADNSWLQSNITWEDLLAKRDAWISVTPAAGGCEENVSALRKMTRKLEDGSSLIYITNISADDFDCVDVRIPGARSVAEIDLETMELIPVHGKCCRTCGGIRVSLRFEDAQSHLLLVNGEDAELLEGKPALLESKLAIPEKYIPVPEKAAFAKKPENMMILDTAALSKDGVNYDEPLSIYGIKDNLLREQYSGRVWIRYTFTAAEDYRADDLRLVVEPMGQDSVTVNGTAVQPAKENWWFDRNFASVNIAPYVKAGENEVIVSLNHYQRDYVYYVLYSGVSESLRNCLVFDTEIEAAYLVGDFALETAGTFTDDVKNSRLYEGEFVLTNQRDNVSITDVVKDGYPFFGGSMTVKFPYDYKAGDATVLALTGRFATASVKVNGTPAGDMLFLRHVDLTAYLREGVNEIEITFAGAMRNLMGPHHRHDPEPMGVGPGTFSFEKEWKGRECAGYLDRYAFVRFGIEGK